MKSTKVAVIQSSSVLFDTAATLGKFETLLNEAAANGAQFVVFPEAFIGGYPKGCHFGAPVGSRSDEGREWFRRYYDGAIIAPGPETERMAQLAGERQTDIVVGVIEHDAGTLYCSVLCFGAEGRFLGKRRKLMPTAAERVIWGMGDGSTLDAFDARSGRISAVICWENFMPMLRMSQYAQGVEIYCAPTVDDRESWTSLMRTVALEGRCFVVSANQFMKRSDAPPDFQPVQGDHPETVLINGGSVIVSPMGELLAGPVFGEETILYADLDPADIARGKMDFDVAGHYARPDIFELSLNRKAQKPVR
ncbi:carbon-nitrogen hydrolase family protein [Hyphococcus flavus]|uniref:Carbon-nitrogen hydrolase family protein n=1 Tax=Hyphococcus flavus TaxID=1866326 RepID=A0AAF0CGM3_9PROT|nr:carbon-nitrogen hydrolase family protein [Hyphococcus flavus]WDI32353.1 carbon-nitrogen hydrolase family protein [Hyphococcus flavus]